MNLVEYQQINDSFKRTLVFHLGVEAGFFSEFNNMVLAMLYCLHHGIRFVLYSDDANFGLGRGWEDVFMPFCEETRRPEHREFNHRYLLNGIPPAKLRRSLLFKKSNDIDFLTFELWNDFRNRSFESELFSFAGHDRLDLRDAARILISMLWRYNAATAAEIEAIRSTVPLPEHYLGVHARSGDKLAEAPLLGISAYMEKAKSRSPLRHVYLLTDNYALYQEACRRHPDYLFSTLCTPCERGYSHRSFIRQDRKVRHAKLLRLLASIDILACAEYFVGTFSANPGMYLGMRMSRDRVFAVDRENWTIW